MSATRTSRVRRTAVTEEEVNDVPEVEQVEATNPVKFDEEPIDMEPTDEEIDEEDQTECDEVIDIGKLTSQSEEIPEELPAPVEQSEAPSEVTTRRARRRAAVEEEETDSQAESSAAPSAAAPKSNVSGGRFAALTKKIVTDSSSSKAGSSRFASLTGKSASAKAVPATEELSLFEYFEANVQEIGPVDLINKMFPTMESVKALSRAEFVKFRNALCWLAGMSEIPIESQFVGTYYSLTFKKQKVAPSHIKLEGDKPAFFMLKDEELEAAPGVPCVYPGDDNEMAGEAEYKVFTFKTQLDTFPVTAQITLIDQFISEYEL